MSLLFPIYLLGALAIGLPLYLHLKRKPPKDSQPVGSLLFWRQSEVSSARRSAKLEDILLLLLRALAILLLALVFARPILRGNAANLLSDGSGGRYLYLVDSSASMQRKGLWQDVQKVTLKELGKRKTHDEVALLAYDQQVDEIISFENWRDLKDEERLPAIRKAIKTLEPKWGASFLDRGLLAALDAVREAEANSESEATETRIIVISDMQSGSILERLASKPWPEEVPVSFLRIESEYTSNASLHPVATDEPNEPKVRLSNSDGNDKASFKLTWVENEVYETHYVAPGTSTVVASPAGFPPESPLELSGDNIPFDNRVVFPPPKPATPSIALVSDSNIENEESIAFFLSRAMIPTPRLQPRLVSNDLTQADFFIVDGSLSLDKAKTIRKEIEKGKSGLFLVDRETAGSAYAALAGMAESPNIQSMGFESDYTMFEEIDFKHPVLLPFAAPSTRDFSRIKVWRYRNMELPPGATHLMTFEDDKPALFELPMGKGKLFTFTTTWSTNDSQLARSTKFIPLLYSLFRESGLRPGAEATFLVGDRLPLLRDFGEGTVDHVIAESSTKVNTTESYIASKPGLYQFRGMNDQTRYYAVNLDPRESELKPLPLQDLARFGIVHSESRPAESETERDLTPRQASNLELEKQQKLFRWLAVIIAFIIILETLLAGSRRSASQQPQQQPANVT